MARQKAPGGGRVKKTAIKRTPKKKTESDATPDTTPSAPAEAGAAVEALAAEPKRRARGARPAARAVAIEPPPIPEKKVEVEKRGNEVVVRFPPAGVPPFRAPEAAPVAAPASTPEVTAKKPPVADRDESPSDADVDADSYAPHDLHESEVEGALDVALEPEPSARRPAGDGQEATADRDAADMRLSPSQRRRLRRRRRRESLAQGGSPPPSPTARLPDSDREPRPPIPPPPPRVPEPERSPVAQDEHEPPRGRSRRERPRWGDDIDDRWKDDRGGTVVEVGGDESHEFRSIMDGEDEPEPATPAAPAAPPSDAAPPLSTDEREGERRGRRRRGRRGGRRRRRAEDEGSVGVATYDVFAAEFAAQRRAAEAETTEEVEEPADEAREDVEAITEEIEGVEIEPIATTPVTDFEQILEEEEIDDEAEEAPRARRANKEMLINVVPREECRIAILENGRLEEIYLERASVENHVGNIYKGRVTNVEPSIQAAFVDFGLGKNGFLHISDLHPKYFPNRANDSEDVGHKTPRRDRPPIQKCLRRGQELIVQIIKEGIGTKGPTLSTYLSIPGRFLVMLPGMSRSGVSRKIEDPVVRDKLRRHLSELQLPSGVGFIARTAAVDRTKRELQSDLQYLTRLWRQVEQRMRNERAPAELYRESDLVIRTIRDVFTADVRSIVVDDPPVAERARDFLAIFSPKSHDCVHVYDGREPLFHKHGIEAELDRLHSRHVPLRSGGSLVIDSTEALVAIDVNSGRYRDEDDAETTAFKINLEAAEEIPRQLRLRDLGGVIICDFIDMRLEKHRREIERVLIKNLKEHKERAKVLKMSRFGIIEMTRQRQRASLTRNVYQDCYHCRGTGLVKTAESVALDVMRLLQLASGRENVASVQLTVSPEVAFLLQNRKRAAIHDLETKSRRTVFVKADAAYGLDQFQIHYYDNRERLLPA